MALLNNWDLKDSNTGIYAIDTPQGERLIHLVTDVGASFGTNSYRIPSGKSNVDAYMASKFVTKEDPDAVSFSTPGRPPLISFFAIPHFFAMIKDTQKREIGRDIPRSDVKWIGQLLSRLSPGQIRSAFEAAGYSPAEVEGFSEQVQNRIAELSEL
jgi:hypothetical protein